MRFCWEFGIKVVTLLSLLCAIEAAPGIPNVTAIAGSIYRAAAVEADISDFPFLVQVRDGSNVCGGSLLDANWVLTAARCVDGKKAEDILVIGGSSYLNGYGGKQSSVNLIELAPYNTTYSQHSDVALLELKKPLSGPNISTIALASSTPQTGSTVSVTGWGLISELIPSVLQSAEVKVTNDFFQISGDYIDSCQGDSGGPLVQNNKLVGFVSYGVGCVLPDLQSYLYTDINSVQSFIVDIANRLQ